MNTNGYSMEKISGILPVNKPAGLSSFDVIRQIKNSLYLNWKLQKIGHGGTLDMNAGGVLPILMGEASKAFDYLLLSDKVYRAVVQFGANTDTDDAGGALIRTSDRIIHRRDIENLLPKFRGRIMQAPPLYSSLHINGIRSYELARRKINIEKSTREVEIKDIILEDFDCEKLQATLTVKCSSGTYIRSLARDIGNELGCGGYIAELTRLVCSGIKLENCISMADINYLNVLKFILPLNEVLHLQPLTFLPRREIITSGRTLIEDFFREKAANEGLYKVVQDGSVLAIIEKSGNKFHYLRVFNE
jgi:tRNA pseudouridine55 synthase